MKNTVLICPKNDEESLLIVAIAEALGIPTVLSKQPHGARLDREKKLVERIRKALSAANASPAMGRMGGDKRIEVAIVEIPGPAAEEDLRKQGFKVKIIDHHRYDDVSRMKKKSSLEQFLDFFKIDDRVLSQLGFPPKMVRAVGAIDRGFIWELENEPLTKAERKLALKFYQVLAHQARGNRQEKEEKAARTAWDAREKVRGVWVVRSKDDRISVRDALSYIVAEEIGKPTTLVIFQGKRRVYAQETPRAKKLYEKFGGFTFGRDRCWGILAEGNGVLPSLDEILEIIVK